jgi:aspartate-semialdehyde dehydrogenase
MAKPEVVPKQNWVLVGGETLLGEEVRAVVSERSLPVTLRLCGPDQSQVLTEQDGEAAVMEPLTADILASARVVLLAGSHEQVLTMAHELKDAPVIVDLTGELERLPESQLRAPLFEASGFAAKRDAPQVIAHPAALALARFTSLVHRHSAIRRLVVTILEPVSSQGRAGIDELHQQTVSLLSFQNMPKAVFDTQVSFNLLPRFGDEARASLETSEQRIERHLATLLAPEGIPLPSLRLVHAPVFHGYGMSIWVEFVSRPLVTPLEQYLASEGVDVRNRDVEPPSNLGVAGRGGITVGEIIEDRNDGKAAWFWLASDNLRTSAENAVLVAGLAARKEPHAR